MQKENLEMFRKLDPKISKTGGYNSPEVPRQKVRGFRSTWFKCLQKVWGYFSPRK